MTAIIDTLERFFDGMGLMTGEGAIIKRILFGAVLGGFLVTYLKPSIMFENGVQRPFALLTGPSEGGITPTYTPWWTAAVLGAFVAGFLI